MIIVKFGGGVQLIKTTKIFTLYRITREQEANKRIVLTFKEFCCSLAVQDNVHSLFTVIVVNL